MVAWNGESVASDGRPRWSIRCAADQFLACQPEDLAGGGIGIDDAPDGVLHEKAFFERLNDEGVQVGWTPLIEPRSRGCSSPRAIHVRCVRGGDASLGRRSCSLQAKVHSCDLVKKGPKLKQNGPFAHGNVPFVLPASSIWMRRERSASPAAHLRRPGWSATAELPAHAGPA
jgi:hypothetical protein